MKTLFKRVDGVALSLVFFYCLIVAFVGVCLDPNSSIVVPGNPIAALATAIGFTEVVSVGMPTAIMLAMLCVYAFLFALAVVIEVRLAAYYDQRAYSAKWLSIYAASFVVLFGLGIAIGSASHFAFEDGPSMLVQSFAYSGECFLIGAFIALILYAAIFFLWLLVYSMFAKSKEPIDEKKDGDELEELEDKLDEALDQDAGDLAKNFGEGGFGAGVGAGGPGAVDEGTSLVGLNAIQVFPSLTYIDSHSELVETKDYSDDADMNLQMFTETFRDYLAGHEKLYYDRTAIRAFVAGLSASRMLILQGLSGTGKSSIARYFSRFVSQNSFFTPVQTTWRDRTSILGYWNDFSRTYNETEFLKRMYQATYETQDINVMVLDEMNIARIEYYFADFLSIMEYPIDERYLKIMNFPEGFVPPAHLEDGLLKIPETTWFIGTANRDDSTYTITDKVYDRSIVISFESLNEPFDVKKVPEPVKVSYTRLMEMFSEAQGNKEYRMGKSDWTKFRNITNKTYEDFELTFGNRVYNQIELFVPVFVACGGSKEEALDFMFAEKIASKLEGRYEDFVKDALLRLREEIEKTYGKTAFPLTHARIAHFLRRFA